MPSDEPIVADGAEVRALPVSPVRVVSFSELPEVIAKPPGSEGEQWNRHLISRAAAGTGRGCDPL